MTTPAAAAPDLVEQAVRDRLQREGRVRVIVELQLPGGAHVPEGLATPAQVAAQRRDIADGQTRILARLAAARHRIVHRYVSVPLLALEVETDALRELEAAPFLVKRVVEDALRQPLLAESGPLVQADQVWARGYDGAGRTIAILDTGVDSSHPFLQQGPGGPSKVVEEACYSSTVDGVSESVCPDGSGAQTGPGSGVYCPDLNLGCWHGTHVAGIAAGSGESAGVPYSGVAPGATLMSVQVFSRFTHLFSCNFNPPCLRAYDADIIAGLERVYERRGAHSFASVNLSLGGGRYTTPCDSNPTKPIIDNLRSAGIATVAAAGNDGYTDAMGAPACVSSAVSVGSTTDTTDQVSSFSNMASFMSLLAPGQTTTSSYPGGTFVSANGTSMATPHVAGAFALLEQAAPGATPTEILDALRDTGQPVTDTRPRGTVTAPRISLLAALEALVGAGEVVIDNAAVGVQDASRSFTGTWCVSSAGGAYGADSLYSCGDATTETYRWTPNLAAGTYDVFVWWTQHVNRSATVPISVVHAGGTSTRTFDQRTGGGQWVFHGRYAFNAGTGGHVEVTDANGQAAADAVRLVPAPPDTTRPDTSITSGPNGTIGTGSATFTWTGTDDVTPADGLVYAYRLEPLEAGFSAFGPATSRTYTGLVNGTYTFHVKSRDSSGNEDASPATRTFTVSISAGEAVIDNAPVGVQDASRSFTGTWCVSSAGGFYGTDSLYSCGNGTLDTYRWTPTLTAGTYEVYVRWTQHSNRSTTVPISVTHAGGTTTRTFNQRTGGGQWVLHGRYAFNAGTGGHVQVTDANGQAAADAVRFVPVPPGEVIVDNAAVGSQDASRSFTGTWCVSSAGGFYGTNSLYSCGNGTLDTYRWTPTLTAGTYDVYVWWTQHPNRSTTVPISVTHAGGTTTSTFNQRTGGGQWVLHGRYTFNAGTGGHVQVSDASGQAAADAVRFSPAP